LKRGLTRLWRNGSVLLLLCGGTLALSHAPSSAAQSDHRRRNELTLGGLRPGKDSIEKAKSIYENGKLGDDPLPDLLIWVVFSRKTRTQLRFEANAQHIIKQIKASPGLAVLEGSHRQQTELRPFLVADKHTQEEIWKTGAGLGLGDSCRKAPVLYGDPYSRSPSMKEGQRLELLHYAFNWAGPDVPQVMEVFCTPEKDGKPGRVVEITLVAPTL
jgi:hypothetical protein